MAITGPHLLTPARSRAWMKVPGPNYVATPAARSVFTISFLTATTAGQTLEVATGIGTVTMVCGPLGDGLSWEAGAGNVASAQNFEAGALQNALLSGAYTITRSLTTVALTARLPGPQYDLLSATPSAAFATGTNTTNGGNEVVQANYSVCIRPLIYTEADTDDGYEALPEQVALPGADGHAQFDLGQLLRPYLTPEWPSNGTGSAHLHTTLVRPYYVEYYERYGTPATNRVVNRFASPTAPQLACLMGYQRGYHTRFLQYLDRVARLTGPMPYFMTWRNRKARRYVTAAEEHHLGWYFWDMEATPAAFTLRAKLTHTAANGTDPLTTDWSDRYTATVGTHVVRGRISSFRVGYNQLTMATQLPVDRVAVSYTVQIVDEDDSAVVEDMTFYLAESDYNERFIQFINSLGIPESMRTVGSWSETFQAGFMELARQITFEDQGDQLANSRSSEPTGGQHFLNVISGPHARAEHRALLDILGAPRGGIRLSQPDLGGDAWAPLRLLQAEEMPVNRRGTEDEHLYSMALQFALDDPQPFRTNLPDGTYTVDDDAEPPGEH